MVAGHYDWTREIENLGPLLVQKSAAPLVLPGRYDLVIDPTQLWLTIHESIGHATELDRILGFEANYAGTTFVRREDLGTLRYGDRKLNVTADRNMEHGLATVAFDDEGVPTRNFPLITDGILVGLQADRGSAQMVGLETTGCAYAEDANYVPLQRMPNISMQADPNGRSREEIVSDVEDGFLVIGDDSWSIDMQRKNFQFTAQQFWRIRNGQLDGMVRDAGYQSTTPQFWGSLAEVGGPQTWLLHGAINCGKGQPGQSAPVGHGAPVARFNQINVISTTDADNSGEVIPTTVHEGVN
jgi:TldD protein